MERLNKDSLCNINVLMEDSRILSMKSKPVTTA